MDKLKPDIIIGGVEGEIYSASEENPPAVHVSVIRLVDDTGKAQGLVADQARTVISLTVEAAAEMLAVLRQARRRIGFAEVEMQEPTLVPPAPKRH